MSGSGLGAWWDPDEAPADAGARREVRPARSPGHAPPFSPGPGREDAARLTGAVEAMSYMTRPSRWWQVGVAAFGVAALAAALVAASQLDLAWGVLAVTALLPAALLVVAEGRQPRRVAASSDGVEVTGRRCARRVTWEELRRVRRRGGMGSPDVDTSLEQADGELVRLPKGAPGGAVEAWRDRVDGGRPEPRLPQVWRVPPEEDVSSVGQVVNLANLVALLAVNALLRLFDLPAPWVLAGYVVMVCAVFLVLPHLPRPLVTADQEGLTFRAWRRKHVPWSQVTDVRRRGRYDPEVVVELGSGEQHEVVGPDEDVVRGWWRLAVPDEHR